MVDSKPLFSLFIQERDDDYRLDGARNYLANPPETNDVKERLIGTIQESDGVDDAWRLKIAEWSFEVVDYFTFDREVVAIALNYIDRFMVFGDSSPSSKPIGKREYQLLTLTSLYTAIKLHGELSNKSCSRRTRPSLQIFVELSQRIFTGADIEKMERSLLTSLKWRLNPPMPISFLKCLLSFIPNWRTRNGLPNSCQEMKFVIYKRARYLTEVSVCSSAFSFLYKPSLLAYASILAAIDDLGRDRSFSNTFPPSQVLAEFYKRISNETSLVPGMKDVRKAKSMLADMGPHFSDTDTLTTDVSEKSTSRMEVSNNMEVNHYQDNGNHAVQKDGGSPAEIMHTF